MSIKKTANRQYTAVMKLMDGTIAVFTAETWEGAFKSASRYAWGMK